MVQNSMQTLGQIWMQINKLPLDSDTSLVSISGPIEYLQTA
jgi:hypothetical protein